MLNPIPRHVPRGPSTCTVDTGSALLTFLLFEVGGTSIVRLTSGGNERIAPPIREAHGSDVEKARGLDEQLNAGSKNAGRQPTGDDDAITCRRQRLPVGANMIALEGDELLQEAEKWTLNDSLLKAGSVGALSEAAALASL